MVVMRVVTYTDPASYGAVAEPVIAAEPVLHALHAQVIAAVSDDPPRYPEWIFYVVEQAGRVPFLAHLTPPYPIHMPTHDAPAARALADHVYASGTRPSAVGGDVESVEAFAARWCELTGQVSKVTMRLGVYDLPGGVHLPWAVSGRARVAAAADLELVRSWQLAFHDEVVRGGRPPRLEDGLVLDGRTTLWCDPEPVAMAQARHSGSSTVAISGVYTPPDRRGHGYASAVTTAASQACLDRGERCMLYTDLENPTSNGIYRALGYRYVGESSELALVDADS